MIRHRINWGTPDRQGFTLVELLVVVTILLIIMTMTILGVNFIQQSDRVTGAASQVQSYLAGARDRAIYERAPRGVRFFVDPNNPRAVSAMAYIQPGESWTAGTVNLQRPDFNNDNSADSPNVTLVSGQGLGWWQLKRRGLIVDGSLIEIPRGSNSWYEIDTSLIDITLAPKFTRNPPEREFLILRIPYAEPGGSDLTAVVAHQSVPYQIKLPSQLLPREPSLLPESVVIDLDGSQIPLAWRPDPADSEGQFSPYMDIFFSPRGNVIGPAAAAGLLHFYVCDAEDSLFLKELWIGSLDATLGVNSSSPLDTFEEQVRSNGKFIPADEIFGTWMGTAPAYTQTEPYLVKDRRIVTLFTQTGALVVNPVDPTDSPPDGFADNPYFFSVSGRGVK